MKRKFSEISTVLDILARESPKSTLQLIHLSNSERNNPNHMKWGSTVGLLNLYTKFNNNQERLIECLKHHDIPKDQFDIALINACDNNNQIYIDILLNDPRVKYYTGNNCLIKNVCKYGKDVLLAKMLEVNDRKINLGIENNEPLRLACENGHYNIVQMLLNDKRINLRDHNNDELLVSALKYNHIEIVKLLLNNRYINPSVNNNNLLIYAGIRGYTEIVEIILNNPNFNISHDLPKIYNYIYLKYRMTKNQNIYNILYMLLTNTKTINYIKTTTYDKSYIKNILNDNTLLFIPSIRHIYY